MMLALLNFNVGWLATFGVRHWNINNDIVIACLTDYLRRCSHATNEKAILWYQLVAKGLVLTRHDREFRKNDTVNWADYRPCFLKQIQNALAVVDAMCR